MFNIIIKNDVDLLSVFFSDVNMTNIIRTGCVLIIMQLRL